MLGAVLVVLFSGNQLSQLAFGCAVAVAVALLHAKSHPYTERRGNQVWQHSHAHTNHRYRTESDNFLAFVANVVVALTFFIGLVLYADQAGQGKYDDSKVSFGAALISLNLAAVGLGDMRCA